MINYQYVPGPLVEALITATVNPSQNVVLVIEEINRANCGAVFGDVFQLLDRNKFGDSSYSIEPSPDLKGYLGTLGLREAQTELSLPRNLYIWATMNSADQGVRPIDSAFRRRWEFEYRGHTTPCEYPIDEANVTYAGDAYAWDLFRRVVNGKLTELGLHEDKLIGPYFLSLSEMADSDMILNKLLLYLWEDVLRYRQRELMDFDSFSEVIEAWQDGAGDPLGIVGALSQG